ncbi:MAG: aminotransferase class V-fold PLP-dependent enzyme [Candidatus Saliniplasma sp.]
MIKEGRDNLDPNKYRKDFPLLDKVTYFDNACMTLKPYQVINAVNEYYEEYPVCGGSRSQHKLSNILSRKIREGREAIADLIGADDKEQIVFTKNTTEAVSLVAKGLGLSKGDTVLTTDKEHNSNTVPWILLRDDKGIEFDQVRTSEDGTIDIEHFKEMMDQDVELVSMVHTSNLDGTTIPAKEIGEIVHDYEALLMLDGAQSVPHKPMDVNELDVDLLAFSVHKMLGPTGVGILYGKEEVLERLDPLVAGGGSVKDSTYDTVTLKDSPEKFEGGLQNYSALCGIKPAVDYLQDVGLKDIEKHEIKLNRIATDLLSDKVQVIGPKDPGKRSGIFNFRVEVLGCHEITILLEEKEILTRGGMHCVHPWHRTRNELGGTRASFYFYNTEEEVKRFAKVFEELLG